ncbi:MAG TPA: GNAT family N-acetyltransferase [Candidatus Baltobacteraceae bacterium]|nr:GNAT family N-acetyltransferase [Candidatus Baltobacteraceae bacterium]
MTLDLRELSSEAYAREILPLTYDLWGRGRTFDSYVSRTRELALTAYGKRSFKTIALSDSGRSVLATFKRYERTGHVRGSEFAAVGIGAVFTPPELRGRGYASAMLGLALDNERAAGADVAVLFSDIHPQFYRNLGFVELPSRTISLRVDTLSWQRLDVEVPDAHSWSGIRACFDAAAAHAEHGLNRTATFWNWLRTVLAGQEPKGQRVDLIVRRSRRVAAYVLGRREPRADAYVLDELGFIDDGARAYIPALLRYAAGDLRRVAGWLPPLPARSVLPRGAVRARRDGILMAAALSKIGQTYIDSARGGSSGDPVWSTDHI